MKTVIESGLVSRRHRQHGVGLVEIMVSLAIGLVIIAALVALFLGTSRNNREMATANSMIENGRFAIQLLQDDVVHAGFWGPFVPEFDDQTGSTTAAPADVPAALPDPCANFGSWNATYRNNILGLPIVAYGSASVCSAIVDDVVTGTDVLVVRHLDTCVAGETGCDPAADDKVYMQAGQCDTEIGMYVLEKWDASSPPGAFNLTARDCTTPAALRKFVSHIYYVRDYAVTAGDGVPTLVRSEFDVSSGAPTHLAAQPLVEGIDGFRVEFGIDDVSSTDDPVDYTAPIVWDDPETKTAATNRGDGIPDGQYIHCGTCTAAQLMNATSVKIHVLARSREPTTGYVDNKVYTLGSGTPLTAFGDGFKRHVYSTTIRLPNIAGRRERP
ncbi:MAG TPA: PilW family protein [Steroidobacteraceae bacterium]|nr:PilW family protein [Steroidobacteraceae bacterium]